MTCRIYKYVRTYIQHIISKAKYLNCIHVNEFSYTWQFVLGARLISTVLIAVNFYARQFTCTYIYNESQIEIDLNEKNALCYVVMIPGSCTVV